MRKHPECHPERPKTEDIKTRFTGLDIRMRRSDGDVIGISVGESRENWTEALFRVIFIIDARHESSDSK